MSETRALGRGGGEGGFYISRFLPNRPRPLSSFDTHARWQPVTQSARSRWSYYGKIEDYEKSEVFISKTTTLHVHHTFLHIS